MNYSRPNLLPFPMTGANAAQNFKLQPAYAVTGDRAKLLKMLCYVDDVTISIAWACTYSFTPSPIVFSSSFNATLSSKNPPSPPALASSSAGFYYSANANGPWPVWPDPASRVLVTNSGANYLPVISLEFNVGGAIKGLDMEFRNSFDGTNFQIASQIQAVDVDQNMVATTSATGYPTTIATTTLSLFGMSIPLYLKLDTVAPVSATFSTPFTATGNVTFQ
jgi:hypothetical protein